MLPSIDTDSVLVSVPYGLLAAQVKLPISEAAISPICKCEEVFVVLILYFVWELISLPLCNHLNVIGGVPLLRIHKISVTSPASILAGTSKGFKSGASFAVVPKNISKNCWEPLVFSNFYDKNNLIFFKITKTY